MRTTLDISVEALAKVRQLAQQRAKPLGEVVSELIMEALEPKQAPAFRNGAPLFPAGSGVPPDLELINRLRDEEP